MTAAPMDWIVADISVIHHFHSKHAFIARTRGYEIITTVKGSDNAIFTVRHCDHLLWCTLYIVIGPVNELLQFESVLCV